MVFVDMVACIVIRCRNNHRLGEASRGRDVDSFLSLTAARLDAAASGSALRLDRQSRSRPSSQAELKRFSNGLVRAEWCVTLAIDHQETPRCGGGGLASVVIGGLPIAVLDRSQSARLMIDTAHGPAWQRRPPAVITSANGQVISMCARDPALRRLFLAADLIHADGTPLVFASRLKCRMPLPERVATTDLFPRRGAARGGSRRALLYAGRQCGGRHRKGRPQRAPSLSAI